MRQCSPKQQTHNAPGESASEAEELGVVDMEGGSCGWEVCEQGGREVAVEL